MSTTKFPVVANESLTKMSNEIIEKHQNKVIVTGVRMVMNNETGKKESLEFEFLQYRTLEGRQMNILGLLHKGDTRWNSGLTKMRVWSTVTREGAIDVLGLPEAFVDAIIAQASNLKDDERLGVMQPIETINTPEGTKVIKIICNETTKRALLPQAIQRQLDGQYASRYILQAPTGENNELENVVDENGNTIYRWFTFGTTDQKDVMVATKLSLSRYVAQDQAESNLGAPLMDAGAFGLAK